MATVTSSANNPTSGTQPVLKSCGFVAPDSQNRAGKNSVELTTRWICSLDELESLKEQWDDLSRTTNHRNAAMEENFLIPAFRHLADHDVAVLTVSYQDPSGQHLAALTPFVSTRLFSLPFRAIQIWKHDQCYDTTPLLRSGMEQSAWTAIVNRLRGDGFSFLGMDTCSAEPPFDNLLDATQQELGLSIFRKNIFERAALRPAESAESYQKSSLSTNQRKKMRRLMRKLERVGQITIEPSHSGSSFRQLGEEFLALEHSGWKGTQGTALACEPETKEFYREMIERSAACNKSRFLTMRLDGKAIAMISDLQTDTLVHSYKTAYDEAFAEYSPGVHLECKNIEHLHRDKICMADSCTAPDNEAINRLWRERIRFQSAILALRPGLPGLITRCFPLAQKFLRFCRPGKT